MHILSHCERKLTVKQLPDMWVRQKGRNEKEAEKKMTLLELKCNSKYVNVVCVCVCVCVCVLFVVVFLNNYEKYWLGD